VILDDEEEMWEFLGRLSEPDCMDEYAKLVLRRNAGVCGRVTSADIVTAVENRISIEVARRHAVYPPNLQYEADNYKGSAGHLLERDQQPILRGKSRSQWKRLSTKSR
jgi:hypothetical protein